MTEHSADYLIDLLRRLVDEYENVLYAEFYTGKPDPRFAEKWPALAEALTALGQSIG